MSYKKYSEDYRLENVLGRNGKLVTKAVYRGNWYRFTQSAQTMRRVKLFYGITGMLSALLVLTLLLFTKTMGDAWYFILPLVALTIPEIYTMMGIWRLYTAKAQFTREHNDKIHDRISPASMFQTALAVLETAGCVAQLIISGVSAGRLLFTAGSAALAAAGVLMFIGRKNLLTEKNTAGEA